MGLPILVAPEAADGIKEGDELTVDLASGGYRRPHFRVTYQAPAAAALHAGVGGRRRLAPVPEDARRIELTRPSAFDRKTDMNYRIAR